MFRRTKCNNECSLTCLNFHIISTVKSYMYTLFSGCSHKSELGCQRDMKLNYEKMFKVAEEKGFAIVDVEMDGDCALHAISRQLQQQGISHYDARILRRMAVKHLESNSHLVNPNMLSRCYGSNIKDYLKEPAIEGTLCDEAMLHAVAVVTRSDIHMYDDNGSVTKFESREVCTKNAITIGLIAGVHYVSLERCNTSTLHKTEVDQVLTMSGASAATGDKCKDQVATRRQEAVWQKYSKLKSEAERRGFSVVDIAQTKDSALYAVCHQLRLQNITPPDVTTLLQRAEDYLYRHMYIKSKPTDSHTLSAIHSDQSILRAVSDDIIMKEIHILNENGHMNKIGQQPPHTKPVIIGVFAEDHYVSLEPSGSKETYQTTTEPPRNDNVAGAVKSPRFQNDRPTEDASHSAANTGSDKPSTAVANDTCAICMDVIKDPKTLPCHHVFCSECIEQSLKYQPKCPCCGKILGVLKGDQPEGGRMTIRKENWQHLEGYPGCGCIIIDYSIPSGRQKVLYRYIQFCVV